jgi:ATPase domain predominantly from Archaea
MSSIYSRADMADQMALRLMKPNPLDEALRSGLFISGQRRQGKTTFLIHDLIPALESQGAIVLYVDLWSNTQASPASLVLNKIQEKLAELQDTESKTIQTLKRVTGLDVGVLTFKFGFKLDSIGKQDGFTIAEAMTAVVDQAQRDVVLIIDEVQHAITTDDGRSLLEALKSARDTINPRPHTPGHFIVIGTGSNRAMVNELITRKAHAFEGAQSMTFPVLGKDYVEYLLDRLAESSPGIQLPSIDVATQAFATVGNRPEELRKALRSLYQSIQDRPTLDLNETLLVVAQTLRVNAAEIEMARISELGGLAQLVFDRVAHSEPEKLPLFDAQALAEYASALQRPVATDEVQRVVNEMLSCNFIMRIAHGTYRVSDPFVQKVWLEIKSKRDERSAGDDVLN